MVLPAPPTWDSGVRRSGPLFKCHSVCVGMCNYGGQAFDPGFPSGLNCPHIERHSVSLGTPLYSAALSCVPLWNSKHCRLKSEIWPVHAPVCMCVCGNDWIALYESLCRQYVFCNYNVVVSSHVCRRWYLIMHVWKGGSCVPVFACLWLHDCDFFQMPPCVICPHNNYHLCQINQRDFLPDSDLSYSFFSLTSRSSVYYAFSQRHAFTHSMYCESKGEMERAIYRHSGHLGSLNYFTDEMDIMHRSQYLCSWHNC